MRLKPENASRRGKEGGQRKGRGEGGSTAVTEPKRNRRDGQTDQKIPPTTRGAERGSKNSQHQFNSCVLSLFGWNVAIHSPKNSEYTVGDIRYGR